MKKHVDDKLDSLLNTVVTELKAIHDMTTEAREAWIKQQEWLVPTIPLPTGGGRPISSKGYAALSEFGQLWRQHTPGVPRRTTAHHGA